MRTYPLPEDGVYAFDPAFSGHNHSLSFEGTDGTVTVEARPEGTDVWHAVPNGEVDMASPHVVRFAGSVDEYRFTLSGATQPVTVTELNIPAGQGVNYEAVETTLEPLLRAGPSDFRRVRVDVGEAGFWAGQQFGWQYELSLTNGQVQVFRFDLPTDVLLLSSNVTVDDGTLYYRVYRADQVTETGTFSTDLTANAVALNLMSFTPAYALQTTAATDGPSAGGGITIDDDAPFPVLRLRTAGSTGHAATTGIDGGPSRGFPPTSAYVVATQLPGANGGTSGVITLKFEERTFGY